MGELTTLLTTDDQLTDDTQNPCALEFLRYPYFNVSSKILVNPDIFIRDINHADNYREEVFSLSACLRYLDRVITSPMVNWNGVSPRRFRAF